MKARPVRSGTPWLWVVVVMALITALPIFTTLVSFAHIDYEILQHLARYVLPRLVANTLWLLLGVGVGVVLLGTSLAWLTAACEFPGRRFFTWALILPLAFPAYVIAFVFIGLFDFTGSVLTALRNVGWTLHLPSVRSWGGVVIVMSLAFYPYVYLVARNAFIQQSATALEAVRSLGVSPVRGFFTISLPMARPWIAAGLLLAWMETLADFGVVSVFNYDTFATAIYKSWYGLFSLNTAAQLSFALIAFSLCILAAEQYTRRGMRFALDRKAPRSRIVLRGLRGWCACAYASMVLLLGFFLPLLQLVGWTIGNIARDLDLRYFSFAAHSLMLAGSGSIVITLAALLLVYVGRVQKNRSIQLLQRLSILGYAFPGAVLAVGFFIPFTAFDNALADALRSLFGWPITQVLKGTLLAMLLAYLVRFLAVSFHPLERGLQGIPTHFDDAAKILGERPLGILRHIHLPLLRPSLFAAVALSFVDIMKEMPITLMLRPFGWDTLAIRVFELTSEGEWERAALPALTIVLCSSVVLLFVIKLTRRYALTTD